MTSLFQNKFTRAIIPVFAILFFLSCQKDLSNEDGIISTGQPADLTTKVTSSVSGFVTDENDAAVMGASVTAGGVVTTTDKYGFFEVKNIQVVKNAAVVVVTRPGYFKGIKTYLATADKAAFFRIKLIPKTNTGSINATSGGNVTLSNGLIIALPANAVVNAATNAAYSGTVNVAAHWINPVGADLNQTMPGDLRGIATDGSLKLLTTYGMAAVELTGGSGELLQIATGKKATLTMPVPASLMATAPATIPLWSFDETNGLWKQEGTANKTGSTYVGEVSHFSFWNCDVPNNYVQFNCTIIDQAGEPVPYAIVRLTVVGSTNMAYGYTNAAGYVSGAVPNSANLLLEVFSYYSCGTVLHSQTFSTTNTNISLGNITVNMATQSAVVTGTVTNCANAPVTNGYIIVMENGWYNRHPISNTGTFNFPVLLCNNATVPVTLIAEDVASGQQSTPANYTLVVGANAIGNLQACGISTQEFITYSINGGTPVQLTSPADSLYHSGNGTTAVSYISGSRISINEYVNFAFANGGIAVGSMQNLVAFNSSQFANTQPTITTPINVSITEYGAVGQFISGNFTGTMASTTPAATYNIVCSFRVRRNF